MAEWDDLSSLRENVENTETQFDYNKWNSVEDAILTFTNVSWDSEYKSIVDWKTDKIRDDYFDNLKNKYVVNTGWNFKGLEQFNARAGKHMGVLRVEEPYEAMTKFNYVRIELFRQPVDNDSGTRREKFYYFISPSISKIAPNTTELILELDSWTTFKNSLTISGLKLERGHYAHALTPASKFLSDPINNNYGITTLEPELPIVKPLISNEKLISFQKNSPRVCIATTASFTDADNFWLNLSDIKNVKKDDNKPMPANSWWMNRLGGDNLPSYLGSNGSAPIAHVGPSYNNAGNISLRVYSMSPTTYNSFIDFIRNRMPQVLKTIQGVFLLDSALIDEGAETDFLGYKIKQVVQQNSYKIIDNFKPAKSDFGYKSEFSEFAKLYTTQFAILEISNLQGKTVEVSIEDIAGGLEFYSRSSAAFPFLKLEAFINGIGGSEKKTYAVKPFNNVNAQLFKSSWEDFKFDLDIPTFGVFAEAAEIKALEVNANIYSTINSANTDFKNTKELIDARERNRNSDIDKNFNNRSDTIDRAYTNAIAEINKEFNNRLSNMNVDKENSTIRINRDFNNRSDEIENTYTNTISDVNRTFDNSSEEIVRIRDNDKAINNLNYSRSDSQRSIEYNNITTARENRENEINATVYRAEAESLQANRVSGLKAEAARSAHSSVVHTTTVGENYIRLVDTELYNTTQAISKMTAYINLRQAEFNAELSYATSSMNVVGNTVSSILSLSPSSFVSGLTTNTVDKVEAFNLFTIGSQTLVDSHNLLNSGQTWAESWFNYNIDWPGQPTPSQLNYYGRDGQKNTTSVVVGENTFSYTGYSKTLAELRATETTRIVNRKRDLDIREAEMERENSFRKIDYQELEKFLHNTVRVYNELSFHGSESIIADRNEDTGNANLIISLDMDQLTQEITNENADNQYATSAGVNSRSKTVDTTIASRTRTTYTDINSRTRTADLSIVDNTYSVSSTINDRIKNVDTAIAERNRIVDNTINSRTQSVDKAINKYISDKERLVNTRDYNTKILNSSAELYGAVIEDPIMYSENSGNAWTDAWGTRGIDVRVRRCSTATEENAGRTFYRYGYNVSSLWIDEPQFSIMKHFSYWQASDLWITGASVNETNKAIIRNIFINGSTIWRNPDEVNNGSLILKNTIG